METDHVLARWMTVADKKCPLCCDVDESIEHLFFLCSYAATVWEKLLMWQGIRRRTMGWTGELHWASTHVNSGSVAADLYRLSLACCIYALWHERNVRIFQNQKTEANILLRRVVQEIH
ncbi:hypothetical protein KY285_010327 [Solanum tuberosum]|nr:hypothetical protein KY289_010880 [Solanum tuberosum]KAH0734620.1 hypothetical protein KY285_010327 [Solanum tuberosum]